MDSLKLADFLFQLVQESIDYKQYIDGIIIDYKHAQSYGNDYIRLSYKNLPNKSFKSLSYQERQVLFRKTPFYAFTLSTNQGRFDVKEKLLRIVEFRHIYESIAAYAVLQLENHLNAGASIKVKGIDLWPDANYAKKYLLQSLGGKPGRPHYYNFERETSQWSQLHQLAKNSRKVYDKEKDQFRITDLQITSTFGIEPPFLHAVLISNKVPVKLKGHKTIDEINIHTAKLAEALVKEISNEYNYYKPTYQRLLAYLYDNYLPLEKTEIVQYQQSEYLKQFIIQPGDIMQLHNSQIVAADSVSINQQNKITVKYVILKTNLQFGERTRTIGIENISYILKKQNFSDYISQIVVRHLSLLIKWMEKRKILPEFSPFQPDLSKE